MEYLPIDPQNPLLPFIEAFMEIINHYAGMLYEYYEKMSEVFPVIDDISDTLYTLFDVLPMEIGAIPIFLLGWGIVSFTLKGEK